MHYIFVGSRLLFILFGDFGHELDKNSEEHNTDAQNLYPIGLMIIKDNTDGGSQYFPTTNSKWHKMLLKLFNHPIYKELSKPGNNGHNNQISSKL